MLSIIDTHAHLDEIENLHAAIENAKIGGITGIIAVGSDDTSNRKIIDISGKYPGIVYPAVGLHPWGLDTVDGTRLDTMCCFIEEHIGDIVAIGEIGLDYDKRVLKKASKEQQKIVLQKLLQLANRFDKPVSIHSRYAWKDCFQLVSDAGIKKAVFHWFTGFSSVLREIIDAGYYISCTPAAEYHDEHRRAVRETPLQQLLLETDSPVSYGRENRYTSQPADLVRSLKAASELKGINPDGIAKQTTINAVQLFGLTG